MPREGRFGALIGKVVVAVNQHDGKSAGDSATIDPIMHGSLLNKHVPRSQRHRSGIQVHIHFT